MRGVIARLEDDREPGPDLEAATGLVHGRRLVDLAGSPPEPSAPPGWGPIRDDPPAPSSGAAACSRWTAAHDRTRPGASTAPGCSSSRTDACAEVRAGALRPGDPEVVDGRRERARARPAWSTPIPTSSTPATAATRSPHAAVASATPVAASCARSRPRRSRRRRSWCAQTRRGCSRRTGLRHHHHRGQVGLWPRVDRGAPASASGSSPRPPRDCRMRVRRTYLGAHAVPAGSDAARAGRDAVIETLPQVAPEADYLDVFCEPDDLRPRT